MSCSCCIWDLDTLGLNFNFQGSDICGLLLPCIRWTLWFVYWCSATLCHPSIPLNLWWSIEYLKCLSKCFESLCGWGCIVAWVYVVVLWTFYRQQSSYAEAARNGQLWALGTVRTGRLDPVEKCWADEAVEGKLIKDSVLWSLSFSSHAEQGHFNDMTIRLCCH